MIWSKGLAPEINWPDGWKLISIIDLLELADYTEALKLSLLRDLCKTANIPFRGGGTYFFQKSDSEQELQYLKQKLLDDLSPFYHTIPEYVIGYIKEEKKHPHLAYYKVIVITSGEISDLKMALKAHKLKAFL